MRERSGSAIGRQYRRQLTTGPCLKRSSAMPAPQSPIASLLAWLTVSVFLLTGAPTPRRSAGNQDSQQQAMAANELAKSFAPLALAQPQGAEALPLFRVRDMGTVPFSSFSVAPSFLLSEQLKPRSAALVTVRRLSLVGTIELRI